MIQETHLSESEHLKLKREWVDQVYSSSFGKKRGVAILVNKTFYFTHVETLTDKEGWHVRVIGEIGGIKLTLLNLYAPNEDCPKFYKGLGSVLADKAVGIILVRGSRTKHLLIISKSALR